ncbi:class I SAM-dependent methyltransferase [Paludibaculum fermentans]|uniref:class I SAM-dependent methyltransferase n=1 Tax=Paludibaculum fermentans TaxID=1473598 RepID=UPI003EBEFBC5
MTAESRPSGGRPVTSLLEQFGQIDIYLFDQLLRGRIVPGDVIFDAGCGGGRNIYHLLREGFDVYGLDADAGAVDSVRRLAAQLAPQLPPENFRAGDLERITWPAAFADVVISSAVLHFARDEPHFHAMLLGTWQALKPGGLLFCRLASSIGMESEVQPLGRGRFLLPDGSERFLVDEPMLVRLTAELGGQLLDPIKTTVVQGQRCMTTWVVRKNGARTA